MRGRNDRDRAVMVLSLKTGWTLSEILDLPMSMILRYLTVMGELNG